MTSLWENRKDFMTDFKWKEDNRGNCFTLVGGLKRAEGDTEAAQILMHTWSSGHRNCRKEQSLPQRGHQWEQAG